MLSTIGMSAQRMPVVEQVVEDPTEYSRIELAVATTLPSGVAALVFLWLAGYPWRAVTWFGPGHSVRWYDKPSTFPLGGGYEGVLLLEDPARLPGPPVPDLSGFSVDDDPVRWLWVVPISEHSRLFAKERGSATLVQPAGRGAPQLDCQSPSVDWVAVTGCPGCGSGRPAGGRAPQGGLPPELSRGCAG